MATEIIEKLLTAYRQLESYTDTATITWGVSSFRFWTYYSHPNQLRLEFSDHYNWIGKPGSRWTDEGQVGTSVIYSNGRAAKSKRFYETTQTDYTDSADAMVKELPIPYGGVAATVPALLMDLMLNREDFNSLSLIK